MNGYFASRDWENYGILVHALKSSSRMLGISGLSAAAARLETAAKENDSETILQGHQPVMDRYGEAVRSIREFLQTAGNEEEPVVLEFAPEEGEPG